MTRLLYSDSVEGEYVRSFRARVQASGPGWVQLDQTAFHVEGGGQPADHGTLRLGAQEVRVQRVVQEGGVVKHLLAGPEQLAPGGEVEGELDWARRFELMRGHTSGHLLAQAAWRLLNARCVGNSIDIAKLRIDLSARTGPNELKRMEDEVNQAIARDRQVRIRMMDRATLGTLVGERGLLELSPPDPTLRAIEVQDYDLCPCSGTHVAQTREVGGVKLLKRESKGQGVDRITYQLAASAE
ncbi:MAG: alanyl-tRNA editing protein [Halobacteriales archaeon]|nr:alanyl-tRNA editing protein [Halobacteriales archaeon]